MAALQAACAAVSRRASVRGPLSRISAGEGWGEGYELVAIRSNTAVVSAAIRCTENLSASERGFEASRRWLQN